MNANATMGLDIYQSHFGEEQLKLVSPLAIPYDVSHNTAKDSREYELFKEIFQSRVDNPRPWGMVSWKFEYKTTIPLGNFLTVADKKLAEGYDCVFINPMIGNEAIYKNVWEQGALAHKGFIKLISFLAQRFPKSVNSLSGKDTFSFCNYFIASPKFWRHYFKFIDSIAFVLNKKAQEGAEAGLVWSGPANYSRNPLVTMRPFVIERLFSTLLMEGSSIRYHAYPYSRSNYIEKFGQSMGLILGDLSDLKDKAVSEGSLEHLQRWQSIRSKLFKSDAHKLIVTLDDPPNVLLDAEISTLRSESSLKT